MSSTTMCGVWTAGALFAAFVAAYFTGHWLVARSDRGYQRWRERWH